MASSTHDNPLYSSYGMYDWSMAMAYKPRSMLISLGPAACAIFPLLSWLAGGVPILTDVGWIALTFVCFYLFVKELIAFPYRFGVGGIVMYLGTLIWFCWDYLGNWSFLTTNGLNAFYIENIDITPKLLAKSSFAHMLWLTMAFLALSTLKGKSFSQLLFKIPQPANPTTLLYLLILIWLISISPYFLFTAENPFVGMWKEMTGFRDANAQARWTVGRTGRVNTNWGAYVAFILTLQYFAALLAAFYAIFMTRSVNQRLICAFIFMYGLLMAFGTGSRGKVVGVALPLIAMLFIYWQGYLLQAYNWLSRKSGRAIILSLLLGMMFYTMMQVQKSFRRGTIFDAVAESLEIKDFSDPRDNTMYSHSLTGFALIPSERPPFRADDFPFAGWITPIPWTAFEFVIAPIPRALWPDKPISEAINWNNTVKGGSRDFGRSGATISTGGVGFWWIHYGWGGVIQGGFLFGLILSVVDQLLWMARRKPMLLVVALAICEFMFASFRDLKFLQLNKLTTALALYLVIAMFVSKLYVTPQHPKDGPQLPPG